jgi:hypothetical protein
MKNSKNFIVILTILSVFLIIFYGSCSAQTPNNYLKITGSIKDSKMTNLLVFEQNCSNSDLQMVKSINTKKNYRLKLKTSNNYIIYFISDNNITKKLEIESGKAGMWIQKLNIDFSKPEKVNAKLIQDFINKNYTLILS